MMLSLVKDIISFDMHLYAFSFPRNKLHWIARILLCDFHVLLFLAFDPHLLTYAKIHSFLSWTLELVFHII